MSYTAYLDAEQKINEGLIRLGLSMAREKAKPRDPKKKMEEMQSFLEACGNPQTGIPAVHVAGTSGKGSVAASIAGILREGGLKVGLHISPYLQSATEKIWVDAQFVSADQFSSLVDWVMPIAQPRVHPHTRASIHGMASVAIAIEGFRREKVDVMVFEAGCGGRFDLTSFVETRTAVITNIGLDHVISLGPTIEDIAWHKAGIARPGAPLITGASGAALGPIIEEGRRIGAPVTCIPSNGDALDHNRTIAKEAAIQMGKLLNVSLDDQMVTKGLTAVQLAGRYEVMPENGPRIVLDGAHNGEKLQVAVNAALKNRKSGPKVGVVGFLGSKANCELLRPLSGKFDHVITTQPRVYAKTACPAEVSASMLSKVGYLPEIEPDPLYALERAIAVAGPNGNVMVTGSFYLVGEMRNRWFPKRRVVLERTSWPTKVQSISEK